MSAREISADNRKYAGWEGRGMIAEKTQWEQEKDKKSDIRGQRVWSSPAPKGLEKDRLPRDGHVLLSSQKQEQKWNLLLKDGAVKI